MILGVGIDIVDINRIEKLLIKFPKKFAKKIFTFDEISSSANSARYYAKRFAAKEAFSKAVGLGIGRGINFTDIEIINDKNGKPLIKLNPKAGKFLQKYFKQKNIKIDLSLTDEPPIAQAIVIISFF